VGYVAVAGVTPNEREIFGQSLLGFVRADRQLAIDGRVLYATTSPGQQLASFARQGYDLVINGYPTADPVGTVAKQFPRTRFLLLDQRVEALGRRPKNVEGTVYRAEEAAYLAGYLAALMEDRKPAPHVISAVAGVPFPGVTRWTVGYRAGAKRADRAIQVLVDFSQDFSNPSICRRIASSQIARGSGVVFNVAGTCGLGALAAAKENHVWGVGVDVDQSFLGPHILTSAVLHLDRGIYRSIETFVNGRFTGGRNTTYDLRNDLVGLGRLSPRVPNSLRRRVDLVRRAIIAGRIKVPLVS
jgi:basic membrane protein A